MMRVVWYSGDESGTCGFMCGKHGCCGPHSSAGLAGGPSEPMIEVLFEDIAGPMPAGRDVFEALSGRFDVPPGLYGVWVSGPRSRSVDMIAFPFPLSYESPGVNPAGRLEMLWPLFLSPVTFFSSLLGDSAGASSSTARPFPLSSFAPEEGGDSPLFLL